MTPEQIVYLISIVCCAIFSYNKGLRIGATAMVTELADNKIISKRDLEKFINIKIEEI